MNQSTIARFPLVLALLAVLVLPTGCQRAAAPASPPPAPVAESGPAAATPPAAEPSRPKPVSGTVRPESSLPTRGDGAPPAPPVALDGQKYALLVGVQSYIPTELKNLKFTERDVTALAEVLQQGGYKAEHIRLLTRAAADKDPSLLPLAANIRRELQELAGKCKPNDSLLIALAGHGVQFKGNDEHYFCPADARLVNRTTLIGLGDVFKELEKSPAGFKLLLVDACRNDPVADVTRAREAVDLESVTRPRNKLAPGGVAALFSCSAGELAFEDPTLEHGVFFHYVIEGLRGDADLENEGSVYLPALELYTKKRVSQFVQKKYQSSQVPDLVSKGSRGLVPLVKTQKQTVSMSAFVEDATTLVGAGLPAPMLHGVAPQGRFVVYFQQTLVDQTYHSNLVLREVATGKEWARWPATYSMGGAVFSPDGKYVAVLEHPEATRKALVVFELNPGRQVGSVAVDPQGLLEELTFAPDHTVFLRQQGVLRRLDWRHGREAPLWPGGPQKLGGVLGVSRDGKYLGMVERGQSLVVRAADTGAVRTRVAWTPAEYVLQTGGQGGRLSNDGSSLLVIESVPAPRLMVYDTKTGKPRSAVPGQAAFGYFCPDNQTLAILGSIGTGPDVRSGFTFLDTVTGRERRMSLKLGDVGGFDISPDGSKLATVLNAVDRWAIKVGDLPASVRK